MAVEWKKLAYEDDVVTKALFDADTFLYATNDDTPVATSPANVMAALSGHNAAEFLFGTQKIGGVVDPTTNQQVATKKYVDDNNVGSDTFVGLTDTPANYTSAADKLVLVNGTPDALVFEAKSSTTLDEWGAAVAAVDFNLQEATDLVVMTVANEAALPAASIALGQLCWATSELTLHVCTSIA